MWVGWSDELGPFPDSGPETLGATTRTCKDVWFWRYCRRTRRTRQTARLQGALAMRPQLHASRARGVHDTSRPQHGRTRRADGRGERAGASSTSRARLGTPPVCFHERFDDQREHRRAAHHCVRHNGKRDHSDAARLA